MRNYEQEQAARQAREDAREAQATAILEALAGIATGTHCLRIDIDGRLVRRVYIEPRPGQ